MPTTGPFRTQADLINEALANLGVLSAGQPTDPEDYSYVQTKLDSIVRKLAALEIVSIPDTNGIPSAFFSDLADIVAGECAEKFGCTGDDLNQKVAKGLGGPPSSANVGDGGAARSLKQMQRGRPTGEVLRVEYF